MNGEEKSGSEGDVAKNSEKSEEGTDNAGCALCHLSVDFADRALFYEDDRDSDDEENLGEPLPTNLFDPQNALVYCDACDRLYHQKCHFVPLLQVPRGDWFCLDCQITKQHKKSKSKKKTPNSPNKNKITPWKGTPTDLDWEFASRSHKAALWKQELRKIQKAVDAQLGHISNSLSSLWAFVSTSRNRKFLLSRTAPPEQFVQTLWKVLQAKQKVREWILNLENIRSGPSTQTHSNPILQPLSNEPPRIVPRTAEARMVLVPPSQQRQLDNKPTSGGGIPSEVVTGGSGNHSRGETTTAATQHSHDDINHPNQREARLPRENPTDKDSVSLDDLQCCICFSGEATDENDVVLCDGQGCCRAYHMHCVDPPATELDEDWFCPLCITIANLLHRLSHFMEEHGEDDHTVDSGSSVESYEQAAEVFPEAPWQYRACLQLKQGKKTDDTKRLLEQFFGTNDGDCHSDAGSDDDDTDDSQFDLDNYALERQDERRRRHGNREKEEEEEDDDDDDDSSHSSQATLVDMSSVELDISQKELQALSEGESSVSEDDNSGSQPRRKRRRREPSQQNSDIVYGKRRRIKVDYRRLNDAMFGALSSEQNAKIDDPDDYQEIKQKSKEASSDSEQSSDPNIDSDREEAASEEDSKEDEDEDESPCLKKATRGRSGPSEGNKDKETTDNTCDSKSSNTPQGRLTRSNTPYKAASSEAKNGFSRPRTKKPLNGRVTNGAAAALVKQNGKNSGKSE